LKIGQFFYIVKPFVKLKKNWPKNLLRKTLCGNPKIKKKRQKLAKIKTTKTQNRFFPCGVSDHMFQVHGLGLDFDY